MVFFKPSLAHAVCTEQMAFSYSQLGRLSGWTVTKKDSKFQLLAAKCEAC